MKRPLPVEKKMSVAVSAISILLLFGLPLIIGPRERNITPDRYLDSCIVILANLAVFYVNYLWLIRRFLFRRQWTGFFAANVVLVAVVALLLAGWHEYYFQRILQLPDPGRRPPTAHFILRDVLSFILTTGLAVAVRMTIEWQSAERDKARLEAVASEAELKNLRGQLNPHFIFNTLNNIYSLSILGSPETPDAILGLGKILRYVLQGNTQEQVPLAKELQFTRSYIDLMTLRLNENVRIEVRLPECPEEKTIAPLIFISPIENAFKHGISPSRPSFIGIDIRLEGDTLTCTVRNSSFPKTEHDRSGSGIGLENLRRRLELLYPGRHTFETDHGEDFFTTKLTLTLN